MNDEEVKRIIQRCVAFFCVMAIVLCAVLLFPEIRQTILLHIEKFRMKTFEKPEYWSNLLLLFAVFGIGLAGGVGFLCFSVYGNKATKKLAGIFQVNAYGIRNPPPPYLFIQI